MHIVRRPHARHASPASPRWSPCSPSLGAGPLAWPPATAAGPVDVGWDATGTGGVTTVSDGTDSAAADHLRRDQHLQRDLGLHRPRRPARGPIKVPWTWQGLHAWFQVTARLQPIVGRRSAPSLDAGPANCCTSPSNGFLYGGATTFDVTPGVHTYGFRLTGSNSDFNNFLRGTFTLSTKPYLDATIGSDNRQWIGAENLAPGVRPDGGPGRSRSRTRRAGTASRSCPARTVTVKRHRPEGLRPGPLRGHRRHLRAAEQRHRREPARRGRRGRRTRCGHAGADVRCQGHPGGDIRGHAPLDRVRAADLCATDLRAPHLRPADYAPRIYAPRIYAPRIYAPDSYDADVTSDPKFRDAFTSAQSQSLLAVSSNTWTAAETVTADRQHRRHLLRARPGTRRRRLRRRPPVGADPDDHRRRRLRRARRLLSRHADARTHHQADATTVIVTDTNKLGLSPGTAAYTNYLSSLDASPGAPTASSSTSPSRRGCSDLDAGRRRTRSAPTP